MLIRRDTIKEKARKYQGSTVVYIIFSVALLFFIGFALLSTVLGSYFINKRFAESEELYFKADRVSQIVGQKMEEETSNIVETMSIYNDDYSGINDTLLTLILANPTINNYLSGITKTDLNNKLMVYLKETTIGVGGKIESGANAKAVSKGLFDIFFKLSIKQRSIQTTPYYIFRNKTKASDTSGWNSWIQGYVINDSQDNDLLTEGVINDLSVNVITSLEGDQSLTSNTDGILALSGGWLQNILSATPTGSLDYNAVSNPIVADCIIDAKNLNNTLGKKINAKFNIYSIPRRDNNPQYKVASKKTIIKNPMLKNAISAISGINIIQDIYYYTTIGTKKIEINGSVYCFGDMPTDMSLPYNNPYDFDGTVAPNNFNGIRIDAHNPIDINGKVVTRGGINIYTDASADPQAQVINIGTASGNVICDSINMHKNSKRVNVDVKGNLSTYGSIRVNGANSSITLDKEFYGMGQKVDNDWSKEKSFQSSSIMVNDTSSSVTITGDAYIGGLAYADGNKYNATYNDTSVTPNMTHAFMLGQSTSQGNDYLVYSQHLAGAPTTLPSSGDFYSPLYAATSSDYLAYSGGSLYTPTSWGASRMNFAKAHLYHYIRLGNSTYVTKDKILLDGKIYAKGIVAANDKLYWFPSSSQPWGGGVPPASFETYANTLTKELSQSEYDTRINTAVSGEKAMADKEVGYLKTYDETKLYSSSASVQEKDPNNLNAYPLSMNSYIDRNGYLIKPVIDSTSTSNVITKGDRTARTYYDGFFNLNADEYISYSKDSPYFIYLSKAPYNIFIQGDGVWVEYPWMTMQIATMDDINGKKGIIFTTGSISFIPLLWTDYSITNFTFDGPIIALGKYDPFGGGINICTNGDHDISFNFNYNDEVFRDDPIVRKFFGPSNILEAPGDVTDMYTNAGKRVDLVQSKLIQ